jgi:hypothetical protein
MVPLLLGRAAPPILPDRGLRGDLAARSGLFWRCFRRTGAGDKVSDNPPALNKAGRFLPSGL